jgi:hypothetical protein
MTKITVNGLDITDNINYLVESIEYRNTPSRTFDIQPISTRPGSKLLAAEWESKSINIKGKIFGTTNSVLKTNVDTFQQNIAVKSLALVIDQDRSYTVTLNDLTISSEFYQNTMLDYEANLTAIDPFAYGSLLTVSGTTVSGTATLTPIVTISGTVFAEPLLSIYPKGLNFGDSGLRAMNIQYISTGEIVSISGMMQFNAPFTIDYSNFITTNSGVNVDYSGIFSRWEPGSQSFTITTVSGTNGLKTGYNWVFSYQPRYYQ